jgi:hypothetical protein
MARWECAACGAMNDPLLATCSGCRDLRPVENGWPGEAMLMLLYHGVTQADAAVRYRDHAITLAGRGYAPVATSWGDERPSAGTAFLFANLEEAYRVGTLLVTYRREPVP